MRRIIAGVAPALIVPLLALSEATALGQTTDQEKKNQEIVRHATENKNRGDLKAFVFCFAERSKNFDRSVGREEIQNAAEDIHTMFPDYRDEIVEMIAQGDSVAVRCKTSGTHRGVGKLPVMGGILVGVAPKNTSRCSTSIGINCAMERSLNIPQIATTSG